ncbi:MAG TPA: UbiA-like polyprenyltransferase [Acidobacteriota bacterium]|nr:UbiA-like polyprenyltransferase [Acidobacteriota bacterium]HNT18558.1 UbiA-like polyprenyltransferase [Acidobacteriota bacterium]HPA27779.1 UbiA-like polyprenyltransferase [Acidobacteriota bacterium]HQO20275.1 UbiA-like polyprenyltransferase [Acidobacteriota bacterium]HQQ47549.1 UbiA-like polyprenyltransferase [Acidobacteriota bacterium]
MGVLKKIGLTLSMIKFHHTVFALPFALISMFWAAGGLPSMRTLFLILLAMVSSRSLAMTANRIADIEFDKRNPRTMDWPLASGELSLSFAWLFLSLNLVLFVLSAYLLNDLCFYLSPVALLFLLGYSFTKRFTWLCHIILGFTDGIAPMGAWLAVTGKWALPPMWLSLAVTFWVAGFDVLYSIQDIDIDKAERLYSIPSRFGIKASLWVSAVLHLLTFVCYGLAAWSFGAGMFFYAGLLLIAPLLVYEHLIITPDDTTRLDAAFFTVNGYISILLLVFAAADAYWRLK